MNCHILFLVFNASHLLLLFVLFVICVDGKAFRWLCFVMDLKGERAFSIVVRHAWNWLPSKLKLAFTAAFKRHVKAYLFHIACN